MVSKEQPNCRFRTRAMESRGLRMLSMRAEGPYDPVPPIVPDARRRSTPFRCVCLRVLRRYGNLTKMLTRFARPTSLSFIWYSGGVVVERDCAAVLGTKQHDRRNVASRCVVAFALHLSVSPPAAGR